MRKLRGLHCYSGPGTPELRKFPRPAPLSCLAWHRSGQTRPAARWQSVLAPGAPSGAGWLRSPPCPPCPPCIAPVSAASAPLSLPSPCKETVPAQFVAMPTFRIRSGRRRVSPQLSARRAGPLAKLKDRRGGLVCWPHRGCSVFLGVANSHSSSSW